jgi:Mrp family chromosome partitioning ATPase
MVREVTISDKRVKVTLASTGLIAGAQDWIKNKAKEAIETLPEVNEAEVVFAEAKPADLNKVEHIIAVMSGKGGVGKSLIASLTAVSLKRKGYDVGILDADITGPSIPKMFGIDTRPGGSESGILPVLSRSGIEIMSINLLLPSEDDTNTTCIRDNYRFHTPRPDYHGGQESSKHGKADGQAHSRRH